MKINFFTPVYFAKSSKSIRKDWTREQYIKAYQDWDEAGDVYRHTLIEGKTYDSQLNNDDNNVKNQNQNRDK